MDGNTDGTDGDMDGQMAIWQRILMEIYGNTDGRWNMNGNTD